MQTHTFVSIATRLSRGLLGLAAALLVIGAAPPAARAVPISAAELLDAKVEFTADFYLSSNNGRYRGTVIHAPGRERRDFDTAGGHQALVLRRDIDEATMMWPERKWYVTTSFQAMANLVGGFEEMDLDRKPAGHETVGGEATTRYDVSGSSDRGGSFTGRMWFSKDGILMKVVGKVVFQGRQTPVDMGLLNVRRVKADPAAFVRPADYRGIPLDLSKLNLH